MLKLPGSGTRCLGHKHPYIQPPTPTHDFISVALEVAGSLEEGVMGILLFLKNMHKRHSSLLCGAGGGANMLRDMPRLWASHLRDRNRQSMHDPMATSVCPVLTWETEAKKPIG